MKAWSPEWFDQLYLNNYDRLKSCAYRSLGNAMLADELVQETFLILLNRQQDLRKRRHPNIEGWLVITLKNLIKNELDRAKHRNECQLNDENIISLWRIRCRLHCRLPNGRFCCGIMKNDSMHGRLPGA